jgi:hypothetical protein
MKIRPMGPCGQTDRHDEDNSRNSANTPKKEPKHYTIANLHTAFKAFSMMALYGNDGPHISASLNSKIRAT